MVAVSRQDEGSYSKSPFREVHLRVASTMLVSIRDGVVILICHRDAVQVDLITMMPFAMMNIRWSRWC